MGDKRTSVRTLPDGYQVTHSPSDTAHPEGRMDLIRNRSPLRERLAATRAAKEKRHDAIKQRHLKRIEVKKLRQKAKGLPPEKSPI